MLGVVVIVAVSVATDLVHGANDAGRLSDLRSYYKSEESGVSSCAGGLHDSLVALQAILSRVSSERTTAESVASLGAQACTPALNSVLFDMATSPPPRSLAGYGVATAADDLYTWAYPSAAAAQTEVGRMLHDRASQTDAAAPTLDRELIALGRAGQKIQGLFETAAARLHGRLTPFRPSLDLAPPASLKP